MKIKNITLSIFAPMGLFYSCATLEEISNAKNRNNYSDGNDESYIQEIEEEAYRNDYESYSMMSGQNNFNVESRHSEVNLNEHWATCSYSEGFFNVNIGTDSISEKDDMSLENELSGERTKTRNSYKIPEADKKEMFLITDVEEKYTIYLGMNCGRLSLFYYPQGEKEANKKAPSVYINLGVRFQPYGENLNADNWETIMNSMTACYIGLYKKKESIISGRMSKMAIEKILKTPNVPGIEFVKDENKPGYWKMSRKEDYVNNSRKKKVFQAKSKNYFENHLNTFFCGKEKQKMLGFFGEGTIWSVIGYTKHANYEPFFEYLVKEYDNIQNLLNYLGIDEKDKHIIGVEDEDEHSMEEKAEFISNGKGKVRFSSLATIASQKGFEEFKEIYEYIKAKENKGKIKKLLETLNCSFSSISSILCRWGKDAKDGIGCLVVNKDKIKDLISEDGLNCDFSSISSILSGCGAKSLKDVITYLIQEQSEIKNMIGEDGLNCDFSSIASMLHKRGKDVQNQIDWLRLNVGGIKSILKNLGTVFYREKRFAKFSVISNIFSGLGIKDLYKFIKYLDEESVINDLKVIDKAWIIGLENNGIYSKNPLKRFFWRLKGKGYKGTWEMIETLRKKSNLRILEQKLGKEQKSRLQKLFSGDLKCNIVNGIQGLKNEIYSDLVIEEYVEKNYTSLPRIEENIEEEDRNGDDMEEENYKRDSPIEENLTKPKNRKKKGYMNEESEKKLKRAPLKKENKLKKLKEKQNKKNEKKENFYYESEDESEEENIEKGDDIN